MSIIVEFFAAPDDASAARLGFSGPGRDAHSSRSPSETSILKRL
ncbi:hypothetical protein ACFWMU_38830 [Streptomyces sp. NPDC058357]